MEKYDGFHDHTSELDVSNKSSGVIFGSGSESREVPPSVEFTFSPTPDLIRGREIILEKERHERLLFLKDKYFHTQCWMFIQALEQQYFGDLYIGAMDDGEYSPSISEDNISKAINDAGALIMKPFIEHGGSLESMKMRASLIRDETFDVARVATLHIQGNAGGPVHSFSIWPQFGKLDQDET